VRFAQFFIDRPVFAIVLSLVILIAGFVAIPTLPIAQYPDIVPPTVTVSTSYPGANTRTLADVVAAPIEQQVNGVEHMLYMSSNSTNDGQYRLTITFELGTNLDNAQVQVQNRVAIAQPQLPEDVQRIGVVVRKASPDITLALQLFSPGGTRDRIYLSNFALRQLREKLARIQGVGDITIFGARDYSMRIWLNPQKLANLSMTASDVVTAIREQNLQVAAGVVGGQPLPKGTADYQLTITTQGRLLVKEEFEDIVVKTGSTGQVTRIKDIARVELGAADYSSNVYANGLPAVGIGVFQLPGTNSLATKRAVTQAMEELRPLFPDDVEYTIPYDTTLFVEESIDDVIKTLIEAILLVVLVIIVFLQSWRTAVIPLLAIPVSLIGTFSIMWLLGFSLNNLSLFGIVLAIGIVVDDAIVVVENIERWIETGLSPRDAAHKSMIEVTPAIIAIAFGLSAVFIPTAFISGITGQFYRQFALTIAASTLLSAFNSLTLSPAIAALILKPKGAKPDILQRIFNFLVGWLFKGFNKLLAWTTAGYARVVRRVVQFSFVALLVYVGLLGLTYLGFRTVPTGFIPPQDTGYFVVNLQLPDAASVSRTDEVMIGNPAHPQKPGMIEIVNADPGVKATFAVVGFSFLTGTAQPNSGAMFVVLKDFSERAGRPELSADAILARIRKKFSVIQEGIAVILPPPAVRGLSNAGGFKIEILDPNGLYTPAQLQQATQSVIAAGSQRPELTSLFSSFSANVPQVEIQVDRPKLKRIGVSLAEFFSTLQIYLGSLYVNDFNYGGRSYRVTAQADAPYRAHPSDIAQLKTRNKNGGMVPLGSLVKIKETTGPSRLPRYNLYNAAEINGSARPGVSTGEATNAMEEVCRQVLPPGMTYDWTELTFQEKLAGNSALFIFPLCVLLVFLTHSAEYESFPLALAIILIVPMCLFSAIGGVWLRGMDNNIFTQIGFVVLVGLSAKNAVLIVEFAKQQEEHGKNFHDAPIEAARLRLRPILMTSFAFILGVLPLLTAKGAGNEMRHALGTAVFYGMIGVTFFGLFLTPVFYFTIRWITSKLTGKTTLHSRDPRAAHQEGPECP
jgi:hydrophobe/amphiphile efflux-1 (HAE1) family protein